MNLEKLNSAQFHAVIIAGCQRLISYKQQINEINVFPVADGDTGENLASTCQAIIEFSSVKPQLIDTVLSIADASIIGARGNSGIIFSQFFSLLATHLPLVDSLDFYDFSQVLSKIADEIPAVVSKPEEGTIITIIQKLALHALANINLNAFPQAMLAVLPLLFSDVKKTKDSLTILRQANVVDAGALGFYYFIEGCTHFLQDSRPVNSDTIQTIFSDSHASFMSHNRPEFRYCTEAVLKGDAINKFELLNFLKEQGDCASLTGNERTKRIHIHTNNPREIFTTLYKKYLIQYPKVDDILRQYELQFDKKYKIALVTDSSADLPQHLIDEYQIHQICLNIHIDDHHLLDKYSFEPDYFYKALNHFKTLPKTSCLNSNLIQAKLENIAKQYDKVLILSVSSKMSSMYNEFIKASKNYNNIYVLDTKTNSAAHGLLLHYAAQLITSGFSLDKIISQLDKAIKNTFIFVMVNQFDSMIRSGRVNKISGKIAEWVNIKPIVSVDVEGRGIVVAKCFSHSSALTKLIILLNQKLQDSRYILEEYCIVHADEKNQAMHLSHKTEEIFNKPPLFIESVSLSIGLHAGRGCVALAGRISDK